MDIFLFVTGFQSFVYQLNVYIWEVVCLSLCTQSLYMFYSKKCEKYVILHITVTNETLILLSLNLSYKQTKHTTPRLTLAMLQYSEKSNT